MRTRQEGAAAYESWMNDFSDPDAMAMDLDAPEFQLGIQGKMAKYWREREIYRGSLRRCI